MPEEPITTVGTVIEVLNEKLCRVRLENGKEILGYSGRALMGSGVRLEEGTSAKLELTAYDFSKGRVVGIVEPPDFPGG